MPPRSIRAKSALGRDERAIAMNLDTREKRASGVHVGLAWRGLLPLPDGTLDQADRQQTAAFYAGIAAAAGTAITRRLTRPPPPAPRLPDRHHGGDVVDPYLGLGLIGLILVTYYLWRTKPPGDWLE